jgi:hypothetical protein
VARTKAPKIRPWDPFPGEPRHDHAAFRSWLLDARGTIRTVDRERAAIWHWHERREAWEYRLLEVREQEAMRLALEIPRLRAGGTVVARRALDTAARVVRRHADSADLLDLGDAETLTRIASRSLDVATRARGLDATTPPTAGSGGGVGDLSEEERDLLVDLLARAGGS